MYKKTTRTIKLILLNDSIFSIYYNCFRQHTRVSLKMLALKDVDL